MNHQFISGPWRLELPENVAYSSPRIWQGGKHIASVHYCDNSTQCIAIARLVAVAPNLLETSQQLLTIFEHVRRFYVVSDDILAQDDAVVAKARAAINLATEQP